MPEYWNDCETLTVVASINKERALIAKVDAVFSNL